jgi:hypothetical protein
MHDSITPSNLYVLHLDPAGVVARKWILHVPGSGAAHSLAEVLRNDSKSHIDAGRDAGGGHL